MEGARRGDTGAEIGGGASVKSASRELPILVGRRFRRALIFRLSLIALAKDDSLEGGGAGRSLASCQP